VANTSDYLKLIQYLQKDPNPSSIYTWHENILRYKDHLVLSPSSELKPRILNELHSSAIVGHSGLQKTYSHAHRSFLWEVTKKDILQFVTEWEVCQHNKGETIKSPGSLQPLPIPSSMCNKISMEFIVGIPKS
jgi:hypothetical protein